MTLGEDPPPPLLELVRLAVDVPLPFDSTPIPLPSIFLRSASCLLAAASAEKILLEEGEKMDFKVEAKLCCGMTSCGFVRIEPCGASL